MISRRNTRNTRNRHRQRATDNAQQTTRNRQRATDNTQQPKVRVAAEEMKRKMNKRGSAAGIAAAAGLSPLTEDRTDSPDLTETAAALPAAAEANGGAAVTGGASNALQRCAALRCVCSSGAIHHRTLQLDVRATTRARYRRCRKSSPCAVVRAPPDRRAAAPRRGGTGRVGFGRGRRGSADTAPSAQPQRRPVRPSARGGLKQTQTNANKRDAA